MKITVVFRAKTEEPHYHGSDPVIGNTALMQRNLKQKVSIPVYLAKGYDIISSLNVAAF